MEAQKMLVLSYKLTIFYNNIYNFIILCYCNYILTLYFLLWQKN